MRKWKEIQTLLWQNVNATIVNNKGQGIILSFSDVIK